MDKGCDVITEKPITIDEEKAQRIIDAQKRTGRHIRVAFNYRYAPHHTMWPAIAVTLPFFSECLSQVFPDKLILIIACGLFAVESLAN